MNILFKICFWTTAVSFMMAGCNSKKDQNATVAIRSTTQQNSAVTVSLIKDLDKITLIELLTDSAGNCAFEVPVDKPTFALIQIGQKYGEVYLVPGYDLSIKENGQDYQIPLTFSGKGSEVNNYISWVNSNVERIKWTPKGIYGLSLQEFRDRFDSLKTIINTFHDGYLDSVILSPEMISALKYKNQIKFSAVEQEYVSYKLNNRLNDRWAAYKNGQNDLSEYVPKELSDITTDVPIDSTLLHGVYADYATLLNYYWRNNVYYPVLADLVGTDLSQRNDIAFLSEARIKKADCPEGFRESLQAFNVKYWLKDYGINTETDSIFDNFKNTYPLSRYLTSLNKTYDEFLALAPGKPAPEFEGLTPDGRTLSLKDLRGKIVYVDVWATWCRPCIAEIPASIKLHDKLGNKDKIEFLNVSVDSRRADWKDFLNKNKNWTGTHIFIDPSKANSLYAAYKFAGLPAYMLIDQAGNIIELKASRPSDEKLEMKITEALAVH